MISFERSGPTHSVWLQKSEVLPSSCCRFSLAWIGADYSDGHVLFQYATYVLNVLPFNYAIAYKPTKTSTNVVLFSFFFSLVLNLHLPLYSHFHVVLLKLHMFITI